MPLLTKAYLGAGEVKKAYLGDTLVLDNTASLYTGALDVVTPVADFAVGSQLLYKNWAGDNSDIRVASTPITIGFLNNKFDTNAWNVATNSGVDIAYGSKKYNQAPVGNDAVQTVESKQPIVNSIGVDVMDGIDDSYRVALTDSASDLTFLTCFALNNYGIYSRVIDGENSGITIAYNTNNTMTVYVNTTAGYMSVVFSNWSGSYPVGTEVMIGLTWVENIGITMTLNGVSVGFTAVAGTRLLFNELFIGERNNSTNNANADFCINALYKEALTNQEILDIYNQWVANENS